MGDGKYDESSDSALGVNAPRTQSSTFASQQESQQPTFLELKNVSNPTTEEEEEDVTSSDEEDELVLVDTQMVDDAAEFAATSQASHPKRSHGKGKSSKGSQLLMFDDMDMIDVPEGEDPEEESFQQFAKLDRVSLSGYDVPIGPFKTEEYEQDLGVDGQVSLFHHIPGAQTAQQALSASKRLVQSDIGNVTGSVMSTARRTREAAVVTGQVGQHLAGEALNAGQGVMIRLQESWPTWPRGFNGGILAFSELLMEGVRSLPPSDAIIRPQGRQMHG
jgi:hypothetical protein